MAPCSILTCKNVSSTGKKTETGRTFHKFPSDTARKLKWVEATGRVDWVPSKYSIVCSIHFIDDMFYETTKGLRRLNANAIPTLHLPHWFEETNDVMINLPKSRDPSPQASVATDSASHSTTDSTYVPTTDVDTSPIIKLKDEIKQFVILKEKNDDAIVNKLPKAKKLSSPSSTSVATTNSTYVSTSNIDILTIKKLKNEVKQYIILKEKTDAIVNNLPRSRELTPQPSTSVATIDSTSETATEVDNLTIKKLKNEIKYLRSLCDNRGKLVRSTNQQNRRQKLKIKTLENQLTTI